MFLKLFIFYMTVAFFAGCTEPLLDFSQVEAIHANPEIVDSMPQRHVQMRGFLYKTETGEFILASEPNLKSCCISTDAKRDRQVVVVGKEMLEMTPSLTVLLEGDIAMDNDRLHLTNANVVEEPVDFTVIIWIIVASCMIILVVMMLSKLFTP